MDEKPKQNIIKVQSVSKARQKAAEETNRYMQKYGSLLWSAALLTAYQGGGYEELKKNYNVVPMKYVELLLDAYRYKHAEEEFSMAQAVARPHLKKGDAKKYMEGLANKLEGKI